MEFEFDKEIDAILRKARGRDETATLFDAHLDADDISAFAENALPDNTRQNYTAHLAECTRCRRILSNVVALNSEAEPETASSIVEPKAIVEPGVPWYRKLFVFPQIAYTMGALVLLFSGFFGYLVLQNLKTGSSDVSFSTNKAAQMEKPAANAAPTSMPAANAAAPTANAPANAATANTATAGVPATNSSVMTSATPNGVSGPSPADIVTQQKPDRESNSPTTAAKPPSPIADADKTEETKGEDETNLAKSRPENETSKSSTATGAAAPQPSKSDNKEASRDDRSSDEKDAPALKNTRSAPEPKKKVSEAGVTRSVGGKTFNNVGGIWFDSAYSKQTPKIVTRGTSEYQKLDSGLRSIADQLGGTVVVLWKEKAYRIQ